MTRQVSPILSRDIYPLEVVSRTFDGLPIDTRDRLQLVELPDGVQVMLSTDDPAELMEALNQLLEVSLQWHLEQA